MSPRLLRPIASRLALPSDADARAYVLAVNAADGQPLEKPVVEAIDAFVIGCKSDGIWSAIKASCILMGARTLSGALVPLVGPAPTNSGPFVGGDYNRKTGLVGNNSSKYLTANINNNAVPQDSCHASVFISEDNSPDTADCYIGSFDLIGVFLAHSSAGVKFARVRDNAGTVTHTGTAQGAFVLNRSGSSSTQVRIFGQSPSFTARTSSGVASGAITLFAAPANSRYSPSRMAFYSFGESLDVSLYSSRISALHTAIGAAIP
jgi:hypothetical protein